MKVLFVTPYFPTANKEHIVPFIKRLYDALSNKVELTLFHFEAKKSVSNYWNARKRLKKLINDSDFDVIHINWGHCILILPFQLTSKLVTTFRGSDVYGIVNNKGKHTFISKTMSLVSQYAAKRSDHTIFVSQELCDYLGVKDHYSIIPSGVDTTMIPIQSKSELRKLFNFSDNQIVVSFLGHPRNSRKRYNLAERLIDRARSEGYVLKFNHIWEAAPSEVFKQLKASDFLLQVSIQEGSPNVLREALACDVSIISTPVGDTISRIGHLSMCYISESYEEDDIYKVFIKALKEWEPNRKNNYQKEVQTFSLENEQSSILEVYQKITD